MLGVELTYSPGVCRLGRLSLLVVLFLCAFPVPAFSDQPTSLQELIEVGERTEPCFVSRHGVVVTSIGGECPDQKQLESETSWALKGLSAVESALAETRVFLTRQWISCGGVRASGCARQSVLAVRVGSGKSRGWFWDYRQELGHVWRSRNGRDVDARHVDCGFWTSVDPRYSCDWRIAGAFR